MKTLRNVRAISAIGLLAASPHAFAADTYRVTANLSHGGKSFASPVLLVKGGVPATVKVLGAGGYRLVLTVAAMKDGTYRISADLHSAYGTAAPVLLVQPGQKASASVGGISMDLTAVPYGS